MAVDGANVDVVWQHLENNILNFDYEIYHMRNTNYGASGSWDDVNNVSNDSETYQQTPCVADGNTFIHVVWKEDAKIWSARSSNGGSNWTERRVCSDEHSQYSPNVAATGANVHVVWKDGRDGSANIYYARSYNNGYSWEDAVRVSADNNVVSENPSIDVITDNQDSDYRNLYVVWTEHFSGFSYWEVLADYEQYYYVVEDEPEKGGGQLMSGSDGSRFDLSSIQVSPIPMRTQTTVKYVLPKKRFLDIKIFDISGRCVRTLFEGRQNSGIYHITWDGKNEKGKTLESGVYLIKAKGIGEAKIIKLN